MSNPLFLDTSGLLCLHDRDDFRHAATIEIFNGAKSLPTTNYVLAEFVPLSSARGQQRNETLSFIKDFLQVPRLKLVWVDAKTHEQAMDLLNNRLDKNYSLCDAVSFIVMRQHDSIEALTTDNHFKQEGFIKLLAS